MIKQTLQSDKPTISDWKRSASNVENMEVIMENSRNDYNYNRETSDPYAPKYDEKIEFCRMKLRKSKFLDCDEKRHLANLDGINLHKDNLMFDQKARDMKKKFF